MNRDMLTGFRGTNITVNILVFYNVRLIFLYVQIKFYLSAQSVLQVTYHRVYKMSS
jgi:hypothetical protein